MQKQILKGKSPLKIIVHRSSHRLILDTLGATTTITVMTTTTTITSGGKLVEPSTLPPDSEVGGSFHVY
jgi:hypothetical protein